VVVVALGAPSDAAIIIIEGFCRIEPDRFVEIRNSAVVVTLVGPGIRAIIVSFSAFACGFTSPLEDTSARWN
jgi:hypothetical protein